MLAAFHPNSFEASLQTHKEGAAAAASVLVADINEGRYEPSEPRFHQVGVLERLLLVSMLRPLCSCICWHRSCLSFVFLCTRRADCARVLGVLATFSSPNSVWSCMFWHHGVHRLLQSSIVHDRVR